MIWSRRNQDLRLTLIKQQHNGMYVYICSCFLSSSMHAIINSMHLVTSIMVVEILFMILEIFNLVLASDLLLENFFPILFCRD